LCSQHKPTAASPKLPIHRSKTRTNGKDFNLPIETRTNSERLQLSEQELERTGKSSNSPNKTQANGEKPQSTEQKPKRTVKNVKLSIKTSNEQWKTPIHRMKTQTIGGKCRKWSHQHTTTQKSQKHQELTLWMGTGFTRPHGGRLMILPVDSSARVLPRQRYVHLDRLCTTLASILRTSILLKNLKKTEWRRCGRSRSDAEVSDGIPKNLREES